MWQTWVSESIMVILIVSNLVGDWIWIGGQNNPARHYCTSLLSSRWQFGGMRFGGRVSERGTLRPTRSQYFPPTVWSQITPFLSRCSRVDHDIVGSIAHIISLENGLPNGFDENPRPPLSTDKGRVTMPPSKWPWTNLLCFHNFPF